MRELACRMQANEQAAQQPQPGANALQVAALAAAGLTACATPGAHATPREEALAAAVHNVSRDDPAPTERVTPSGELPPPPPSQPPPEQPPQQPPQQPPHQPPQQPAQQPAQGLFPTFRRPEEEQLCAFTHGVVPTTPGQGIGCKGLSLKFYEGDLSGESKLPNGQGTYRSSEFSYSGSWCEGRFYGTGIAIGRPRTAAADGGGRIWFYAGDFTEGCAHGYGFFQSSDGSTHVGEWRAGARSGIGIETAADGRVHHARWERGYAREELTSRGTDAARGAAEASVRAAGDVQAEMDGFQAASGRFASAGHSDYVRRHRSAATPNSGPGPSLAPLHTPATALQSPATAPGDAGGAGAWRWLAEDRGRKRRRGSHA